VVKRTALVLGFISLLWLMTACSGDNNTVLDTESGPLAIKLFWAEPATGASPLRVTFTVNITGGVAPYFYAWDYSNDGSFDDYRNAEFARTLSNFRDYFLKASDAGGVTQYEAIVRVTDSEGTVVTSDPITINVLGSTGFILDENLTYWYTDETDADDNYVARTGLPVYFRAQPVGGTPPYDYQWDFNNDGSIDSTVVAPQYTFTYNDIGVKLFIVSLTVVDGNGERVYWDYYVPVNGTETTLPGEQFSVILNSSPAADETGTIYIDFDPTGGTEGKPLEPELQLSIVVDPNSGGTPPFEYYWDFEDDGALDSQHVAPTIPYYDPVRKILINPYLHTESSKSFTLRCMVIDGSGRVEQVTRTIVATNISNRLEPIEVTANYGVAVGAGGEMGDPYAQVTSRATETKVLYQVTVSGSPGASIEYQFDANGDGVPEIPEGGAGWEPKGEGNTFSFEMLFRGAGYFPSNIKLRQLAADLTVTDTATVEVPVSLVQRDQIVIEDGTLTARKNHTMAASWTTTAHPSNGQTLVDRQFVIAGGSVGSTPLNTVEQLYQQYTPPAETGQIETLASTVATERTPLNVPRVGAVMWADNVTAGDGAAYRIHGGKFNVLLASNELSSGGTGVVPWTVLNEMLVPQYYPLRDAGGTVIPGMGFVLAGGVHKPADEANEVVSGRVISYNTMFDSYGTIGTMPTPRYDVGLAYANDRLYVIGGRGPTGQSVSTVEAFDPVTGTWDTFTPSMNEPRSGMACQTVGGKIYVVGGADWPFEFSNRTFKDTAEVFNPITGVWSYTLPLPPGAEVDNPAFAGVPSPGSTDAGGAVVNSVVIQGGEEDVPEGSKGEVDRMYEFTYFHAVELAEEPEA